MEFFYEMMSSPAPQTYHGLMNQGATCYLNSVLQVLFMTEDFREAVKRHICDNSGPELIDLLLTSLFDDLQEYTAYTYKITKKLGIDNVYEQRDAAEYFEKILGLTSREASQIFHGQQTQKTICSTCSTETGSDTPFWNLTLALVNSYKGDFSVVAGIEEYFRDSSFSGENQMYCDACQAKSDATIKWEIKDHPEVLMLLLKRFEFDYRYMTYVKINCSVNVPCTLQIPENQTYELYAVVDHFGDLRSGYYTATIKPQDTESWHTFNDDRVTLPHYQPFQVDNFERSSSAYLLFYRKKKVHAADTGTCTPDTREMSSPGGFLPDIYNDQFEKAEVKRGKFERAAEPEQTIDRNEKPAIKDVAAVGSSGVELSDLYKEDQDSIVYSKQSNHQDCEKDMNDVSYSAEKLRDKDKIMTNDEEGKRGNAEADNQPVGRGSLSGETQQEESVDDPNDVRPEDVRVRHRRPQEGLGGEDMHNTKQKQEVSNMHPQVCVDMQKVEKNMAMDVNRDKSGRKGREGIASTKYLENDEERRDDEGFDHVRQNKYEDQKGTQKVSQDDFKPLSVDKQEDGEGMKTDDEERKARRGKLLTRQDLYNDDIQGKGVGKSKENMSKDDQRFKRKTESRFYQSHEQPGEERDVKGDKQPKRRDDVQSKGASARRGYDQDGRSERVTTQKDVGAVIRARGGDEHIQRRADSSLRQAGSAGSSRVTENRGDGSVEESQPSKARTGLNEEGKRSSKQSKICHGKIIEEETHSGVKTSTVTKNIIIKTEEGSSRGSLKILVDYDDGNAEIESDPKTDTTVTLSEDVGNLQLNDSPLPKLQKHRKELNETESTIHSNYRKTQNVRRRSSPLKQNGKEKKKRRTVKSFYFCRNGRKTADQTSESD